MGESVLPTMLLLRRLEEPSASMLSALLLITASCGFGTALLQKLKTRGAIETWTLRIAAGLPVSALVSLAAGTVSLRWAESILAIAAVGTVLAALRATSPSRQDSAARPPWHAFDWLCLVAVLVSLGFALVETLVPQTHPLALSGPLAAAAHLASARQFTLGLSSAVEVVVPSSIAEVLYAVVFHGGGEFGVALLAWSFAVLAAGATYALGARCGGQRCGLVAAAMLVTSPLFAGLAPTVVDALVCLGLSAAALLALAVAASERSWHGVALCGFLAGSACGVSQAGLVAGVLVLPGIAVLMPTRRRYFMVVVVFFILAATPWQLLQSAHGAAPWKHWLDLHEGVSFELMAFIRYPWDLLMRPQVHGGWQASPGPLALALLVPGLCWGGRTSWLLATYAALGGGALYFTSPEVQEMLPFIAPLLVVGALTTVRAVGLKRVVAVAVILSLLLCIALRAVGIVGALPVLAGQETKEEYLRRSVPAYDGIVALNRHLSVLGDGRVLSSCADVYHFERPVSYDREALTRLADQSRARQLHWLREGQFKFWVHLADPGLSPGSKLSRLYESWREDDQHFRLRARSEFEGSGADAIAEIYELTVEEARAVPQRTSP